MPELPEVETVRRGLAARLSGRRITSVRATGVRTVRRYPDPAAFEAALAVADGPVVIAGVDRHGKYLLVRLADGRTVVVHLRMSGQLLIGDPAAPLAPHTHVVVDLDDGAQLRFVDPRTFGEWFVTEGRRPPELAHLGPDAWTELPAATRLRARTAATRVAAKVLLTDQRFVAGIGNIYADEILFRARVRPDRPAASLRPAELTRIHATVGEVLGRAIDLGGSTLGDQQYVDLDGVGGRYQEEHAVYGQAGRPCPTCGRPVVRLPIGARSAFACARCQR